MDPGVNVGHNCFPAYFKMSVGQFALLLAEMAPHLRKQRNTFREPTDPE